MKYLFSALLLVLSFTANAQSDFYFGGSLAYNIEPKEVGINAKVKKIVGPHVDYELSVTWFPNDDDQFTVDGNAYYITSEYQEFLFKPYMGVNYYNYEEVNPINPKDDSKSDIGINFGFEIAKHNPGGLSPFLNFKYVYSGLDGYVFGLGLYF